MIDESNSSRLNFGTVTPILRVADFSRSLRFYQSALGFELEWEEAGRFAALKRGGTRIMLCLEDQGQPGMWLYVGVSDVDRLHAELLAKGTAIRHPPTNYPWGARELQVADPDGHVLRFASEANGEPIGAWRDARGALWRPQEDGSWREA